MNAPASSEDAGMVMLAKKNAGLFSHQVTVHPNTKPAFH